MTTYKKSGVDVEKAEDLVRDLKTRFPGIGSYAGIFEHSGIKLAATCDGVGTKIKLAVDLNMHEGIGIDLVAMSINDLIAGGAKPLFFLDYFACGKLSKDIFNRVLQGIEEGMKQSDCLLLGGETAEMPGMYKKDDYDLAGFACGAVFKEFKKKEIKKGDLIIGIDSAGVHSNGFSLVRKIFNRKEIIKYKDLIMAPTRIYADIINSPEKKETVISSIKSIAHVTGGGINRALKRLLPDGLSGRIFPFELQGIFDVIGKKVERSEMKSVFNMGWGMFLVAEEKNADMVSRQLDAKVIGTVE